jgi:TolA-binding protein
MRISMKRAVVYSAVLLGFSTLLVQCVATQQDVEYTNVKVRKMDTKVEDINKEVEELKKQTVQSVQARQAETGDRLDYQQSEILRLQSKIDETNVLIRQVQEENRELKKLMLGRMDSTDQNRADEINKLKERQALTDQQLVKILERVTFAAARRHLNGPWKPPSGRERRKKRREWPLLNR